MANGLYVAYYRVSTAEQGRSGLGIEAQKETVSRYLNGGVWKLIEERTEYESGTKNNRPVLKEALDICKNTGATLIIARLDRLSRNSAFITALMESKVKFVCCDMPEANDFTITIMAALAAVEAKRISSNTKAALASKREWYKAHAEELNQEGRRCGLGTPNLTDEGKVKGNKKSAVVRAVKSAEKYALVAPMVKALKEQGMNLKEIAEELTRKHIEAPRAGSRWHATSVKRVLDRI
jgi:hypothetical protein